MEHIHVLIISLLSLLHGISATAQANHAAVIVFGATPPRTRWGV